MSLCWASLSCSFFLNCFSGLLKGLVNLLAHTGFALHSQMERPRYWLMWVSIWDISLFEQIIQQLLMTRLDKVKLFCNSFPNCTEDHSCLLSLDSSVGCWGPLPSSQSWHFRYQVVFSGLSLLKASNPGSHARAFLVAASLLWWVVVLNFYTHEREMWD